MKNMNRVNILFSFLLIICFNHIALSASEQVGTVDIIMDGQVVSPKIPNGQCIQEKCPNDMCYIPSGEFMIGCSPGEKECAIEDKPHKVRITKGFCMDRTEVTQSAFKKVMGYNPSFFCDSEMEPCNTDEQPEDSMVWLKAKEYCDNIGKRLPTEEEWEYAARGGTTTTYYWGDEINEDYAWYNKGEAARSSHNVGRKKPNGYGLYDMLGNVWEWTSTEVWVTDVVEKCSIEKVKSVKAELKRKYGQYDNTNVECQIVLKGGSWDSYADSVKSNSSIYKYPDEIEADIGFRCVKD